VEGWRFTDIPARRERKGCIHMSRCECCGRRIEIFHVAVNGNDYNLCKKCCIEESKRGKRVTLMTPKGIDINPEVVVFS